MAGDENKTDPVTLCGDSGAGNQPCGSFKCLNMGLQSWIGFMVLVEMVWQVSATGTGPISREWGEEANLAGRNARAPRQVTNEQLPRCTDKSDSDAISHHPSPINKKVLVASLGGSVTLPCNISNLKNHHRFVEWIKDGVEIAHFHERAYAHYTGSDVHWKFVHHDVYMTQDATLLLTGVKEEDKGSYSCVWSVYRDRPFCELLMQLVISH
ncbi:uncharacterized protein LOC129708939 [Leucoraja erinacea]|uniref:uncharacterized protein LOC129708939 n=1 Tax=Leucoraja erinaceus TaxID=7782 RepID=UPI00245463EA|nr:uncharacterized protein LOC129708939 [Leucoraja erinacea]